MMQDEEELHEDAEEIRKETADHSPELAEHDRLTELEKALEDANSKALYAAAEVQNVRRRLEAEKSQAAAMLRTIVLKKIAGEIIGRVIETNRRTGPAPSIDATS